MHRERVGYLLSFKYILPNPAGDRGLGELYHQGLMHKINSGVEQHPFRASNAEYKESKPCPNMWVRLNI